MPRLTTVHKVKDRRETCVADECTQRKYGSYGASAWWSFFSLTLPDELEASPRHQVVLFLQQSDGKDPNSEHETAPSCVVTKWQTAVCLSDGLPLR
jgi:hypothetical protein